MWWGGEGILISFGLYALTAVRFVEGSSICCENCLTRSMLNSGGEYRAGAGAF